MDIRRQRGAIRVQRLAGLTMGLLLLTGWVQADAAAATYYVSPTGSDAGAGTSGDPWETLNYASGQMAGGDTLIVMDGVYAGAAHELTPPSGSPGSYTIVKAENDGGAVLTGMDLAVDITNSSYIQVEGLAIKDLTDSHAVIIDDSHHIKLLRTSIRNGATWYARYGNVVEVRFGSHHVLLEDVWVTGTMRSGIVVYSDDSALPVEKVIVRRAVIRSDGNLEREPLTCAVFYGNTDGTNDGRVEDLLIQNSICLDTNTETEAQTLTDGFANAKQAVNVGYQGTMAVNLRSSAYQMSNYTSGRDNWAVDTLAYDCDDPVHGKGFYAKDGSGTMTLTRVTAGFCNHPGPYDYGSNPPNWSMADSISTQSPLTIPNLLEGDGVDGAVIVNRYGADGTLWDEAGYDTLTATPLWPWPYEDRIKAVFAEPNDPPEGANDTIRGFAGAESLTHYLWEYLGTPCPAEICDGGGNPDTTPPSVTLTAPADGATVSGTATATATASDDVAVANVQFQLDGAALGAADPSDPYATAWDTTGYADGSYTLTVLATDTAGNQATSAAATVTVSNALPNQPPVADAGIDLNVTGGEQTSLNGTASSDPDGDALTYAWTQDSGPVVSFDDATSATPGFMAPGVTVSTDLGFTLTVSDGQAQAQDSVLVTVLPQADPPDGPPPLDETVEVSLTATTGSSATIVVTSDEPVSAAVRYGYSDPTTAIVEGTTLRLTHSLRLDGLTNGSLYHFQVEVGDGSQTLGVSPTSNFTTHGPKDKVAPNAVTGMSAEVVDDLSARLLWEAAGDDGPDGEAVAYEAMLVPDDFSDGPWPLQRAFDYAAPVGTPVAFVVNGLTPGVTYGAKVRARDEAGNWGEWSEMAQVTTMPPIDRDPPVLTGVQADPDAMRALVLGTTNEPAHAVVSFGTDPAQLDQQAQGSGFTQTHEVWLESLQPETQCYFQVEVTDVAGNTTSSLVETFVTLEPDLTPPAPITDLLGDSVSEGQVNLQWTSPYEDRYPDRATSYEVRYRAETLDAATWDEAMLVPAADTPTPGPVGTTQVMTATGLLAGQWAFGMRSVDASGNLSAISNVVTVTVEAGPPEISDFQMTASPHGALTDFFITWETNKYALCWIEYGLSSYSSTTEMTTGTEHAALIKLNVQKNSYIGRVVAQDTAGRRAYFEFVIE